MPSFLSSPPRPYSISCSSTVPEPKPPPSPVPEPKPVITPQATQKKLSLAEQLALKKLKKAGD